MTDGYSDSVREAALLASIREHFSPGGVPEGTSIVDDVPGDLERQEIRAAFERKAWDSIEDNLLRYHAEALFFFTPAAWAYYIPAYLAFMVRDLAGCDFVSETIVGSLVGRSDEIRSFLNPAQRTVIINVLLWLMAKLPDDPWPDALERVIASFRA
jgi:hypothetical protein